MEATSQRNKQLAFGRARAGPIGPASCTAALAYATAG
jgi:hypothetical protein